jgi:hypothetical protein
MERKANDLLHSGYYIVVADPTRFQQRQSVVLGHLYDVLHLLQKLLTLLWLTVSALWQHNRQQVWFFCTNRTTDYRCVCSRGPRRENVIALGKILYKEEKN